jgi:hypothetical protein
MINESPEWSTPRPIRELRTLLTIRRSQLDVAGWRCHLSEGTPTRKQRSKEVMAGREAALHVATIDMAADRANSVRRRVDILAPEGAEAKMVQTHTVLDKSFTQALGRATLYSDRGASACVLENIVPIVDLNRCD